MGLARLRKGLWLGLAVVVIWFFPLALTYTVPDFTTLPHSWEDQLLAAVLGVDFAYGPGSGLTGTPAVLTALIAKVWLVLHTAVGAAAIVLGILQFSTRLRDRHRGVHRMIGMGYVCCALVSVAGAAALLLRTPLAATFSGPSYGLWLWLLAVLTAVGTIAAPLAARRRSFLAHQALAAYSFALLMSAPLLRLGWIAVGVFWHASKEELNRAAELWTVPLLITCALVAVRLRAPKVERAHRPAQPATPSWRGLAILAPLAAVCAFELDNAATGPVRGMLRAAFLLPLLVQAALYAAAAVRAHRAGRPHAAVLWRLNTGAAMLVPPVALALFPLLRALLPLDDALLAAASIGWLIMSSTSYLLTIPVHRPSKGRPGPRTAVGNRPSRANVLASGD
jgi:hypothetical protein